MYDYAIEILEKEKQLIENCLTEFDEINYPLAKEERELKLKQLRRALIQLLR